LPVFYEIIPLTLEEIFIEETEVRGYDVKKLILGE
jgi:ABC-2 type transport system ATP-binding protein